MFSLQGDVILTKVQIDSQTSTDIKYVRETLRLLHSSSSLDPDRTVPQFAILRLQDSFFGRAVQYWIRTVVCSSKPLEFAQ